MATIRKRGDKWQALVERKGHFKSATFATKKQAVEWSTQVEADILSGKTGKVLAKTLGQLLTRYRDEVSTKKKGAVWEILRINQIVDTDIKVDGEKTVLGDVKLADIGARHFAAWRDARLQHVSAESVRREWTVINSALNIAIKEWEWLTVNALKNVKRPEKGYHRERIASYEERDRILEASGYTPGQQPSSALAKVGAVFELCCETGLRRGEIVGLDVSDVSFEKRTLYIRDGKTNAAARGVPLSSRAIVVLKDLIGENEKGSVLGLTKFQVDAQFKKIIKSTGIKDLHLHDARHTAVTHLAGKLNVLDLARVIGHSNINQLQTYYNKKAEDLVPLLD